MFSKLSVAITVLVLSLAFMRLELSTARGAAEPLLVVVGVTFPADDIKLADLKTAFRGQATTVGGKRIIPINHPIGSPLRVAMDKTLLGLEPSAVARFWVDRRIRDEGNPPTTASTPELALRIAASLASSITYSSKALLNPKVKALTIDGKAAGAAGYALNQ
jgi:hypothetical protein